MPRVLLSQYPTSLLVDIWNTVGIELLILGLTLLSAWIIRHFGSVGPRVAPKAHAKHHGAGPRPAGGACGRAPLAAHGDEKSRRQLSAELVPRRPLAAGRRAGPGSTAAHSRKAVQQVMDEIVVGAREQRCTGFAGKAVSMYEELRVNMRENGVRVLEAAQRSEHSVADFYTAVVNCAIRARLHHLVEEVIDDMIEQDVPRSLVFYESAMKQLAGQKQFRRALAIYDHVAADGLEPSPLTFCCLLSFAAEVGELQRAIGFFEKASQMSTPSIRTYMTVLRVHAKRQDWPSSMAILREMERRNVRIDSLALNVVLATGVAADQLEEMDALLLEAEAHDPPTTDVVSYNTLIKGCAQRGALDVAVKALARLRGRGFSPNAITFNTMMNAAVRGCRIGDAWSLVREMRAAGLQPDKFSCSILARGLGKNPKAQWVSDMLELLLEAHIRCGADLRSTLYQLVLEATSQIPAADGGPQLAAKAYAQMRKLQVVPTTATQRLVTQVLRETGVAEH